MVLIGARLTRQSLTQGRDPLSHRQRKPPQGLQEIAVIGEGAVDAMAAAVASKRRHFS